jgi:hypothetical protein
MYFDIGARIEGKYRIGAYGFEFCRLCLSVRSRVHRKDSMSVNTLFTFSLSAVFITPKGIPIPIPAFTSSNLTVYQLEIKINEKISESGCL